MQKSLIDVVNECLDRVEVEGASRSTLLDLAFAHVGIDDWGPLVQQDPRFMRPAEVHELRGDAGKAEAELGWKPTTSFNDLIAMMVDADLAATRQGW